jgi:16S rRNA (guanine527-N7)-methyltransferase
MDVSRETLERLEHFQSLVLKWTDSINLVSSKSKEDIWSRHITDSMQLFEMTEVQHIWADLGSGGGFPGLVVAILAKDHGQEAEFTLVESDQRKCTFLRTASRELELGVNVVSKRIEAIPSLAADVVSARALADLSKLLWYVQLHMAPGGTALLPKGQNWKSELEIARESWSFNCEPVPSVTSPDSVVLKIGNLERA